MKIFLPLAAQSRYHCAWKMAYFSTTTAPERRTLTGKNRVWDFFAMSSKTHPANRRQPLQPRRKIRPVLTKTVSGIPYWPARDQIGEDGGMNLYGFVGNDGVNEVDILGLTCVGKVEVMFTSSERLTTDNPNYKENDKGISVVDDPHHYRISGRRFAGYMNVFDEDGALLEALDVVSGGHREPNRPEESSTPIPAGEFTFSTTRSRGPMGYDVKGTPGRSAIQIHGFGTTTGCIATKLFEEQLVPLIEATKKDKCCKHRENIPIEIWYNMKDGNPEPEGNTFGHGDARHKPKNVDHVVPPPPRAIPVPGPSNPGRHSWWPFW